MQISPNKHAGRNVGLSKYQKIATLVLCGILLSSVPALAEHTRWWRQSSFDDLAKGTANGAAIRSDGKLFLAPRFTEFADANLPYVLALRTDSKGNLYAGGGSNAKVLRFDAGGKATTVFESQELAAQALAIDPAGNLFVGTSPDGKVYKVTPGGQSSTFFDPKTKYIWDLALDRDGTLYVATGDTGTIFAVKPDGKGDVFYSSEEAHIRTLALDGTSDLLAGTEPDGLVLRIPKAVETPARKTPNEAPATNQRRAFVLYETSKKEITALLRDPSGNIYVAAVGEKLPVLPGQTQPPGAKTGSPGGTFTITLGGGPGGGPGLNPAQPSAQGQATPFAPFPTMNSSSVYRIATDGSPKELWSSRDSLVYALGLQPNGKLLLGTGNQGTVLELEGNEIFSRLVRTTSGQATSIAAGPDGKLFVATGNPGKVYTLGPGTEMEGSFVSQPFDAGMFSRWGRLDWWGAIAGNNDHARVEFYARSGNTSDPDNNWSAWAGPYSNPSGDKIDCPAARFVQWKAVMHGGNGPVPELDWVNIAYLPKNVAPVITAIALQDPGVRAQSISIPSSSGSPSAQLRMPQPSSSSGFNENANAAAAFSGRGTSRFESVPQGAFQKGYQTVLWTAEDANDDDLEFSIYYRGENETAWKLLKDKITNRFYSWDTTAMPDGVYYLKIAASDTPSNPPAEALTGERESDRFQVDNTPPTVTQLTAVSSGTSNLPAIRVRFQAGAPASSIARAQYSLDSNDWTLVFPTGELSDSSRENYDFQLQNVGSGEHTVTVRVFDEFDNVSSAKATVRLEASGGN